MYRVLPVVRYNELANRAYHDRLAKGGTVQPQSLYLFTDPRTGLPRRNGFVLSTGLDSHKLFRTKREAEGRASYQY